MLWCCRLYQANKHKALKDSKRIKFEDEEEEVEEDSALVSSELDGEETSHFDSLLNLNKPKGLVDGLSQFFTPSNKRKSRVSLSSVDIDAVVKAQAQAQSKPSLSPQPQSSSSSVVKSSTVAKSGSPAAKAAPSVTKSVTKKRSPVKSITKRRVPVRSVGRVKSVPNSRCDRPEAASKSVTSHSSNSGPSQSQQVASRLVKRSKLHAHRGRKKSEGPPGSGQLKGLFDGLSHLYTAQGERKRTFPIYNPLTLKHRCNEPSDVAAVPQPAYSAVVRSIPNDVCSSSSVVKEQPQTGSVLSVLPATNHDSDCDADGEDEGEEEEEEEDRDCFTGVKVRPGGSGKGSEGQASTDTSDSEEEEEGTSASQAGSAASSRLGPGQASSQRAAQDEGKILVSLASFGCLVVGLHSLSLPLHSACSSHSYTTF